MRNACKTFTQLSLALSLFIACSALARAQARDPRLVSARAGGVNFVSGDVTMRRDGRQSWQGLRQTDDLRSGDTVRTGTDGRAEILLNPGSYLRVGANSEFVLTDASLDTLRLKIVRGSALVEASIYDGGPPPVVTHSLPMTGSVIIASVPYVAGFRIEIDTPQAQVLIVRSGVYRVNVGNTTEFYVRDGRALVGRDGVIVKEGKGATIAPGGAVEVVKFDKKQKDDLDVWSKHRAEELARVNSRLPVGALNTMLTSMRWDSFKWGYNPTGFWFYDWTALSYTYIPFSSCRSPYGYVYNIAAPGLLNICDCYRGSDYHRPPPPIIGRYGNGGGTTTGGGWGTITSGGGTTTSGGGGMTTGGGSTFGGGGSMISHAPADSAPASTAPHPGSESSHRIDPPL
ncbi:MAG: hypothetical protein QOE33_449 [Acidobacteriota bacterium]|nr:hypothetical protein [Acidobacteriota bacterium]